MRRLKCENEDLELQIDQLCCSFCIKNCRTMNPTRTLVRQRHYWFQKVPCSVPLISLSDVWFVVHTAQAWRRTPHHIWSTSTKKRLRPKRIWNGGVRWSGSAARTAAQRMAAQDGVRLPGLEDRGADLGHHRPRLRDLRCVRTSIHHRCEIRGREIWFPQNGSKKQFFKVKNVILDVFHSFYEFFHIF